MCQKGGGIRDWVNGKEVCPRRGTWRVQRPPDERKRDTPLRYKDSRRERAVVREPEGDKRA